MGLKEEQEKFDVEKLYDSIREGQDQCGTYEFCSRCNKEEIYPCARAMERFKHKYIRIAFLHVER